MTSATRVAGDVAHRVRHASATARSTCCTVVGLILPIDAFDEEPHVARYYRRLASFGRVIHFDPRGVGSVRSAGAHRRAR